MKHGGSQRHQHIWGNLSTLAPTSPQFHLYRCHCRVVLPGSERLKDSQAVKANDRGHHQVAVQQIHQGAKTLAIF